MPRNGSGSYSRVAGTPYVYNTAIDQIIVNNEMDDIATALTNSVAKNGETTMTANLPMGGYKLTGLAAGTGNGDSIRHEQVATSAALRALVSDETGTGSLVFATSPTLVTPILGTPTSGDISNCTGSPTLTAPALGTPTALVGTNITGTAAGLTAGSVSESAVVTGAVQSGTNPKFRSYLSSSQTVSSSSLTKVAFNAEEFDISSGFDYTTNNRFVAPVTGYYYFSWCVGVSSTTDSITDFYTSIQKGGSATVEAYGSSLEYYQGDTTVSYRSIGTAFLYLAADEYVEIFGTVSGGGTLTFYGHATNRNTWFGGYLVP